MIVLSRPVLGAEETQAVSAVLQSGRLVQGAEVARFEGLVRAATGRAHAVAVSNGTAALRVALEALGITAGDHVLVPDLTWPSPAHAVLDLGALPILVDVDPDEWNARPESFARACTDKTRAAIVIDQFGNPSRVREVEAALPGIPVVVDAACSLGSHTGEAPCGALGVIATHSFHPRKVLTTGEGGMCLTDDEALAERMRQLRNHGQRAPGDFARASGNYRLSELAATLGCEQMARLPEMVRERNVLAARYDAALPELSRQRPISPAVLRNHQTYGVVLPDGAPRDRIVETLRARGVETARLSYALHTLPQLARSAEQAERAGRSFEHGSRLAEQGLALPLWPGLSEAAQHEVIATLRDVLK